MQIVNTVVKLRVSQYFRQIPYIFPYSKLYADIKMKRGSKNSLPNRIFLTLYHTIPTFNDPKEEAF